jgi:hypothetical protein
MHELVAHVEDEHGDEGIFETEDFTVETRYELESDDLVETGYRQDDEDGFDTKETSPDDEPTSINSLVALLTENTETYTENGLSELATAMAHVALETGVDMQVNMPYEMPHSEMPFPLDLEPLSTISMHQILSEPRSSGQETASDHDSETEESESGWTSLVGKRKPEQLSTSFFSTSITNHRESSKQRLKVWDSIASPTRIFAPPRPMSAAPPPSQKEEPIKRSESTNALDKLDFGFDLRKVVAAQESSDSDKPKDGDDWVETDSDEEYHDFYDVGKGRRRRRDRSKRSSQQWNQGVAPPGPVAALVSQLISKKDAAKEKKIAPVADGHVAVQQYHAQTLNIPSLIQSSVYTTADGERRYKCPHNGCTKEYKNPGGIKYHMQHAHFVDTGDEELNVVIKRPYGCTVKGCSKRYRNLGGLKYHIEHSMS